MSTYDNTKTMLNSIRQINESKTNAKRLAKGLLKESEEGKNDAIAITNDPKFGQNVLKNQIDAFKQTVHLGAKFGNEDSENPENNPLIYYPKTGNLIFSGTIPTMSDLKFQFSLNDSNSAPYIFVDGLTLTSDNLETLKKLHGYYNNWREEFLAAGDMLEKLR